MSESESQLYMAFDIDVKKVARLLTYMTKKFKIIAQRSAFTIKIKR